VEAEKKLRNDDWLDLCVWLIPTRQSFFCTYAVIICRRRVRLLVRHESTDAYLPDYARKLRRRSAARNQSCYHEIMFRVRRWRSFSRKGRIAAFQWYTCDLRDVRLIEKTTRVFSLPRII